MTKAQLIQDLQRRFTTLTTINSITRPSQLPSIKWYSAFVSKDNINRRIIFYVTNEGTISEIANYEMPIKDLTNDNLHIM